MARRRGLAALVFSRVLMRRALIVGCGYTGSLLAARLLDDHVSVVGTSRSGTGGGACPTFRLDLLGSDPIDLCCGDAATVYFMVGPLAQNNAGGEAAYLAPIERFLAALAAHQPSKVVYLSATSVYGDRDGDQVDVFSHPWPDSLWGWIRLRTEEAFLEFGGREGVPVTVCRLPEIYGPGRGPLARLRAGRLPRDFDRLGNRIHVEDLVEILGAVGRRDAPRVLLVSDCEPATAGDVYRYAAGLIGARLDAASAGEPVPDRNLRAMSRSSKRCDNVALLAWFGQPLRFPTYREGLQAIARAESLLNGS
jgi:nucleoside-diphosphate-sugar epimerase